MSGESRSSSSNKARLKVALSAVRNGASGQVLEDLQKWVDGKEEPIPDWDLLVGATFWNRCVEKNANHSAEELLALGKVYEILVKAFIRQSKDSMNYMERLKVFAATFKFFIHKEQINLDIVEELLQEISKSSFYVRMNDSNGFNTVCTNFYALIWNYMREHHTQFELLHSLAHASLSVRWLVVLGLEQFQNISNKLSQIGFLLVKSQMHLNSTIADFFTNLVHKIVEIVKQVLIDDSMNGVKVKKSKSALPVSKFHGFLNMTFVLTRQLALFGDYEKALKVYRPITSVAKVYFDTELTQIWKNILEAYVKMCIVFMNGAPTKLTNEAIQSYEQFRDCRKQILDLNFQKSYPGYAFSFMYAFSECIGVAIAHSRNGTTNSVIFKQLPFSKSVKFLKEIQLAADACVALDNMKSGKHVLEGVTENRKVDVQSTALFHVLKIASQRISDKDSEINKEFQQVTESSFSTLMTVANRSDLDRTKSADLHNTITFHTCNIGYAYQKRKDYKEAMSWCYRSIDAYEAFKNSGVETDLKINILSIGLLLADCHRQLENFTEGLRWLSKWLLMAPQYVSHQSTAYDTYEQIPWLDWSVHWQAIQKEVCARNVDNCQTVLNYLEEDDPGSVSDKFSSRVLRLEMNAYFSGRQTIVPAIMTVGQQLTELGFCGADKVLGLVCQAVGLWWIATEESLHFALQSLYDAIGHLDEELLGKEDLIAGEDSALRVYLSGLTMAWKGLCCLKLNQCVAEGQLDALKEKITHENPDKLKDRGDGLYAVPAFTTLTIEDEARSARDLLQATESFYQLAQMEEVFKIIVDTHCPALAQITVRMVALCLSALGDKIGSAKAWYSTFIIAKLYDRKGLVVLAASEVLKILPCTNMDCVKYAEKVNKSALEGNFIKHNKAVSYRLDLAKALACYQMKNYEEGARHLVEVYQFLSEKDNFDSTHHLMADADYVLSLYRSASLNHNFEFPSGLPEMLCKMTPAGIAVKGYKLLGGLSRETDVMSSGWTDLLHNYYLLGSMGELSSRTVKLLKETGKLRDLKCFITDAVYFYQRLGVVSRSVAMLIPLIETDIAARNFYMAQIRVSALSKVVMSGDCKAEDEAPPFADAKKYLETNLKIPGLSISRLENVSNLKWHLGNVETTSFHYRNRSTKYLSSLKVDCKNIDIKNVEMKAASFLRHPLTCFCYTCSHTEIIPSSLEFLAAQAKYTVAMTWKMSMAILELARLHHQRSMFRVLFNIEYVTEQLQPILTRKTASKLLHTVYGPLFFKPGFQIQLANMEICPVGDVLHIVQLMNTVLRATDIVDPQDFALKALPMEIGSCALYEYFVTSRKVPILGSNIREILQARIEQQEKENTVVASSPEIFMSTIPSTAAPPALRRKGAQVPLTKQQQHGRKANVTTIRPRRILNSKAQLQQKEISATVELVDLTKVDNFDEERHIPVIPPPNFDDSNGN